MGSRNVNAFARTSLILALILSPAAALAGEPADAPGAGGCEGASCTCGGENGQCPLHRPGSKRAKQASQAKVDFPRPAFDANTVATMYGTVTSVERLSHGPGFVGVHLKVQVGRQLVTVHLGPAHFVDPKLSFAEKDVVQFTGSNVTFEGRPTVVATLVTRGQHTVRLREDDGTPLFRL